MNRLFQRHQKRKVVSLDGFWKFKTDPDKFGVKEEWFEKFPSEHQKLLVPGCWNNELGLYHYEGAAWYETEFETKSSCFNLVFYGFTGQIDVYVDGKHQKGQYGGFAGFECLIEKAAPGTHKLTVLVDNTHNNMNTIPLSRVDWFHYGGLFRSVELMELNDVWIKDYKIDYVLDQDLQNANMHIDVTLQSLTGLCKRKLSVYVNDQFLCSKTVSIDTETAVKFRSHKLDNIRLWDTENPNLYLIRLEISDDDITERIGFRKVTVENGRLLLNNKEVVLKGVNRHEDHPDWGFALPLQLMKKDLDIIKNLGCNTIRGSHYPNAPVFLDLLDQEGILFWEEIPMWGFPETALEDPLTLERGLLMHELMIKRDFHHPAIILWGMHNEIDTRTQAAYDITKAFVAQVRSLDKTRPLTYATMYPIEDICLSLVDIISVNKYFGWYVGSVKQWEDFLQELKVKMKNEGLVGMPIIISEFGAGAIYGESTFEGPKWTENFQEKYLEYTLNLFLQDRDVIGTYIWQYCDIRTARELELSRPRSFNNKGIVNEYRKPKLAYWKVKQIYTK